MTARTEIKFAAEDGPFVRWLYRFADRWAFPLAGLFVLVTLIVVGLMVYAVYFNRPDPTPAPTPAYSFCSGKAIVGPCSLNV